MSQPSSSQSRAPPSGQRYQSIFGGSSSQIVSDSEPSAQILEDGNSRPFELHGIMEKEPIPQYSSSDDMYEDSDDELAESTDDATSRGTRSTRSTRSASMRIDTTISTTLNPELQDSPPSSPEYRANRFHGPPSTWRKLTLEDRLIVEALEESRARDLAAHLYNAYALLVRAREIAKQATETQSATRADEAFIPPKSWVAWPLPANEVPRGYEHQLDDEAWTIKMPPDPDPTTNLEESIMAAMLKHAKGMFRPQDWDVPERAASVSRSRASSVKSMQDESSDEKPNAKSIEDDGVLLQPELLVDEDKSRDLLRPKTRSIVMEVDRLLRGLHHDRKRHRARSSSSASERSPSRGRKRNRKPSIQSQSTSGQSRSSQGSRGASSAGNSSHEESKFGGSSVSRSRSEGGGSSREYAPRGRMRLRNWTKVLQVASDVGWPPAVIMRAFQRCNDLFEGDGVDRRGRLEEMQDVIKQSQEAKTPEKTKLNDEHRRKDFFCPFEMCDRHTKGFSRRWNLNQHMQRMHPGASTGGTRGTSIPSDG